MKRNSTRLQHRQTEQTVESQQTGQQTAGREFESAEEMLRHDAAQTPVPPAIKTKLAESIRKEAKPKPEPGGWRRLFKPRAGD